MRIAASLIAFCLLSVTLSAQGAPQVASPVGDSGAPARLDTVIVDVQRLTQPSLEVPDRPGGWVVEVRTSGGFRGATSQSVISSSGGTMCAAPCRSGVGGAALTAVTSSLTAAAGVAWPSTGYTVASHCSDCITTQLSLWQRAADGNVQLFRMQWDQATLGSVDPAIRRLHADVLSAIRN